jgi:hypothetical protein
MMTFVTVVTIIASCLNGDRACYIDYPTSWDDEQIYVVACEMDRRSMNNNPGKIMRSFDSPELKLEMIKCPNIWI